MSRDLYRDTLPISLTPHSSTAPAGPPSSLLVTISSNQSSSALTLTLSDFSSTPLLLSMTLTPATYAPLRASQSLRVTFADFPHHLAGLFGRLGSVPAFSAVLVLPDGDAEARLSILETNQFRVLPHLEVGLARAGGEDVLRALREAMRAAEERARDAGERRAEAEAERVAAVARAEAAEEEARKARVEGGQERIRREAADAKAAEAEKEVGRMGGVVEGLEVALGKVRRKARVCEEVVLRQEKVVGEGEGRIAELEREVGRVRNALGMVEVERDGLRERVRALKEKVEEAEVVAASNVGVIAYLNRELNEREAGRRRGRNGSVSEDSTRETTSERGAGAGASVTAGAITLERR